MKSNESESVSGESLFDKVWGNHLVVEESDEVPAILYVDLHLVHEVSSPQAFAELRARGISVRKPSLTLGTLDHAVPTRQPAKLGGISIVAHGAKEQISTFEANCAEFGVRLLDMSSDKRGIVHVIGPELGLTRPGMTIVCGDSHTSTHGAFGALAFGIGTTEVTHVLATQCLLQRKPKTMAITVNGNLGPGVTAKDLILGIIGQIGVAGGIGHVFEYRGTTISNMTMEERMTICNMSIEAGARAGMISPDATTIDYLRSRISNIAEDEFDAMTQTWLQLASDPDTIFDREVGFDADVLQPMITFGTNPGMVIPITGCIPDPGQNESATRALEYMHLEPGQHIAGQKTDTVFIGSCTNSRLSDLRLAASILKGKRVAKTVRTVVVPGSQQIKMAAQKEGLDKIFLDAGAEWHDSGCSMCIALNGDTVLPGQYCVSTSNRNFEGRQGTGSRTFLASPLTAAASAITGVITDPREFI